MYDMNRLGELEKKFFVLFFFFSGWGGALKS